MYTLKKISPLYGKHDHPDHVEVIGTGDTENEAIEVLRKHFLTVNQRLVDLSKTMDVPDIIMKGAKRNIERNNQLNITVRENGIVFVDDQGPEMDYYTIKSTDE